MKKIAIFASGSGTNAQNITEHFKNNKRINVEIILSNNTKAEVLERAEELNVPSIIFTKKQFYETDVVKNVLIKKEIDLIVLAGFLWLVPESMLNSFPKKIINIHPALLPKYGGKNMYGIKVHEAVLNNNEKDSGITIHYVNKEYDKGDIIFQKKCKIGIYNTPGMLEEKLRSLEHEYFPKVIEKLLS